MLGQASGSSEVAKQARDSRKPRPSKNFPTAVAQDRGQDQPDAHRQGHQASTTAGAVQALKSSRTTRSMQRAWLSGVVNLQ